MDADAKDIECYMIEKILIYERDAFFALNGSDSAFLDRFMWIFTGKAVWLPLALFDSAGFDL